MTTPPTCLLSRRSASAAFGLGGLRTAPPQQRQSRRRLLSTAKEKGQPADWNHFISRTDPSPDADTTTTPPRFTLAVKDNIATRPCDGPTTCASAMLAGYHSPFEATIVEQLRARGAAVVGKTNLDEFGMGSHSLYSHWGRVADPSSSPDAAASVGGSSGGAAVAVRLGDAAVALGTDTGGSVRLPAAYGGVVGFKPSYGMLSRYGVVPYANSLDTVGLLARDVGTVQKLVIDDGLWREADTHRDPTSLSTATRQRLAAQREGYASLPLSSSSSSPSPSSPLAGLTFGLPLEYNIAELDPRIRAAWTAAAARLQSLGATVAAVALPSTRHALAAYYVLAPAEAASNLARYDGVRYGRPPDDVDRPGDGPNNDDPAVLYETVRGAGLGREVQRRILLGAYALSSAARDNYFVQAQRVRRLVVRDFDAVFRLANPLRDAAPDKDDADGANIGFDNNDSNDSSSHINLSDLPDDLPLADKRGPARVDFVLCPTAPTPAPRLADVEAAASPVDAYVNDVFTVPASLAGLPAISIPTAPLAGTTTFCPGLQLIGQFWDDARLLAVARTIMDDAFRQPEDRAALAQHRQNGMVQS